MAIKPKHRLFLKINYTLFIICFLFSYYAKNQSEVLPGPEDVYTIIKQDPIQDDAEYEKFKFEYRGSDYLVEPVAEYEMFGLVVSHNDISALTDIYHTKDSVDFRDICVIWGDMFENDAYTRMEYWSEPWTCFVQSKNREDWNAFSRNSLSNNHLLTDNLRLRDKINEVRIGDQIKLKGMLVNYVKVGQGHWRKSSTIREDTGNGACEVFFVEDFQMIEEGNKSWHKIESGLRVLQWITAIFSIFTFFYLTYTE